MSLADWQKSKWLVAHKTGAEEIAALLAIVERDLANAKVAGLADDWKFNIAYNAALQAATAALAASGFRAAREQHHFRTVQSLALTVGWPGAKVERFDRFRKKRNVIGYESAGVVSEREAREIHELATELRDSVLVWLRKHHPRLLKS
ncbi:MAG TPA: hypothetical protein VMI15_09310 [Burkholderiales bacterium]|nr:hypothetical protein [Burkholderiales bacterium]